VTRPRTLHLAALCGLTLAATATGCASASDASDAGEDEATAPDELRAKTPPACLGASQPLTLFHDLPFTDVTVGGVTGAFLVDLATTGSAIDALAFPAPGPSASRCPLGASCTFEGFTFFGGWGAVQLVSEELDSAGDAVHQAGILGVPTVPVRVAGVTAVAQLDTGFADTRIRHSVNINTAFFDAIQAANPGALVRDAASDLSLTTCAGVAEPVEAWRLAPGMSFDLVGESGAAARTEKSAVLFVKRTPAAARRCGGIGTWSAPAAQVATSFYVDAGVVVFDPFASRVWINAR